MPVITRAKPKFIGEACAGVESGWNYRVLGGWRQNLLFSKTRCLKSLQPGAGKRAPVRSIA
jgi:hypothetical protein